VPKRFDKKKLGSLPGLTKVETKRTGREEQVNEEFHTCSAEQVGKGKNGSWTILASVDDDASVASVEGLSGWKREVESRSSGGKGESGPSRTAGCWPKSR